MMLRLNRLTVSPRAHQRGHGFRPDPGGATDIMARLIAWPPLRRIMSARSHAPGGSPGALYGFSGADL
jgi:hypothetical protein